MFKALSTIAVVSMLVAGGNAMPTERQVKAKPHQAVHVTADTASAINAKTNGQWVASEKQGTLISGATRENLKRLMGAKPQRKAKSSLQRKTYPKGAAVPDSFDAATQWPDCPTITHIRDQSACGSCWAVAAAEAISDRYCTLGGPKNLEISAANLMECCWWCGSGCDGGQPSDAWAFWTTNGLASDACQPYPFPKCSHHVTGGKYPECPSTTYSTPSCSGTCTNNSTEAPVYYKGKTSYTLQGEADFQQELMTNGPFEVAFSVYADFPLYKGGVYVQTSQDYLGGHAVRLVGWGVLDGVKYWKIANSWNSGWGLDGYFLIKRGVDECGIEDEGAAGQPLL